MADNMNDSSTASPDGTATAAPAASGIVPTPALQGRPDYIAGEADAANVHVHRGRGLRCDLVLSEMPGLCWAPPETQKDGVIPCGLAKAGSLAGPTGRL